ncbi:hypothetical protein DSM3645_15210 [Blastopirellula marina DSM 3645]|uniref:Galactosyltransferase C-terminal domain-containing protein n=1 Tax=Blastopirellula marina DSM 3645 TaxID=314230 RepID=A4A261_9BACT|nr:hypothetical protein DSM3645_15210 [Blastopirellula marina DSM 3645]
MAEGGLLVFLDADILPKQVWLLQILAAFNRQPGLVMAHGAFMRKNAGKTGSCVVLTSAFVSVRGYREEIDRWGYEEIDLFRRLAKVGKNFRSDSGLLDCLHHSDGQRTQHYPERDKERGHEAMMALVESAGDGVVNPNGWGS